MSTLGVGGTKRAGGCRSNSVKRARGNWDHARVRAAAPRAADRPHGRGLKPEPSGESGPLEPRLPWFLAQV
eukprot:3847678-Prymnesium_polylepis.1